MSTLLYHLLIYPISLLPLRVLYLFTDFFFLLLITIIPYRRKVVRQNIKRSFPNNTKQENRKIERKFYRHLTDLLAEGVKNLSISEKELTQRFTVKNPEVLEDLYKEKINVLLVSGHYNNWEWLITGQNLLFKHQAVGIGMPLSSKFWDKKLNERRARYGMHIIHAKIVKDFFTNNKEVISTLVLADQSPTDSLKSYWTEFLNQQTAVLFGPEMLANEYNQAVVYFETQKMKRGYYQIELQEVTRNPRSLEYGVITEKCTKLMEETILRAPEYWLWSHKRWKREIPNDLEGLRKIQKEKFEKKYR